MQTDTAEKFAGLLAQCAVSGSVTELRKEAAAHNLVKQADVTFANSLPFILPAVGLAGGGLAGYFGTADEKRKKRNAVYGAITGGLLGAGSGLAAYGSSLTSDATKAMGAANQDYDKKTNPEAATKTEDKPTGNNVFDPDSGHSFSKINPYNATGRGAGILGGGAAGYISGDIVGRALDARADNRAYRQQILNDALTAPKPSGKRTAPSPVTWQNNVKKFVDSLWSADSAPAASWVDRFNRFIDNFREVPRAQTGARAAARDALNLRPFESPKNPGRPLTKKEIADAQKARAEYEAKRNQVRELGNAAKAKAVPTSNPSQRTHTLAEALRGALTRRGRAAGLPAHDELVPLLAQKLPDGTRRPAPRTTGRYYGRRISAGVGGTAGTILSHPYFVERLLNYFYDPTTADTPAQ